MCHEKEDLILVRKKDLEGKLNSLISFKGYVDLCKTNLIYFLFRSLLLSNYKQNNYIVKNLCLFYDSPRRFTKKIHQEDSPRKMGRDKPFFSKKGISPVVATVLLLVVSVVAVIGFENWYQTYQSQTFTEAEKTSSITGGVNIETIIGSDLYINNKYKSNYTISSVKIGGIDCNISQNLSLGMNKINISNCLNNVTTSTPDIVVLGESNILSKTIYYDKAKSSLSGGSSSGPSINCSTLNGGEWIFVPGNPTLGTNDFCVMKYEAKNVGGVPTSQAANTPWVFINQTDARAACAGLGAGYHLITDAEWVTIARLAENNPSNWNSSQVGVGFIYSGHNDNNPSNALAADTNDANGYYGTGNTYNSNQRRTLNISGSIIWDLAGNVWEWTNDTGSNSTVNLSWNWYEWTQITGYDYLEPSNSSYDSNYGVGMVYTGGQTGTFIYAFLRGGHSDSGALAGAFALALGVGPSSSSMYIGFRCSYSP